MLVLHFFQFPNYRFPRQTGVDAANIYFPQGSRNLVKAGEAEEEEEKEQAPWD